MTRPRTESGQDRRSWLARRWPGAMLVGALVILAGVSGISTAILQRQQIAGSRDEVASTAADTLRSTMQQLLSGLRGAGAVVGPEGALDVAAFASFGRGLSVQPGVTALALEQVVTDGQRSVFERRSGLTISDRRSTGAFFRSPVRPVYYPVIAVSPDTPTTRTILGFDIGSDPVRGPVTASAMVLGTPQLSPPLELTSGASGFLVVAPVYRQGQPLDTSEARRDAAVGFVSGAYVSADLIDLVERRLPPGTKLAILDEGEVVQGDPSLVNTGVSKEVSVGGRTWDLAVAVPGTPNYVVPVVLFIVSLLLAAIVQLAISLARRREQGLESTSRRLRAEANRAEALGVLSEALLEAERESAVLTAIAACSASAFGASQVRVGVLGTDGVTIEVFGVPRRTDAIADLTSMGQTSIDAGDPIARATRDLRLQVDPNGQEPLAVAPLHVDLRPLGALSLQFDTPRSFDAAERTLLTDLASAGSRTLEQARLFAEVDAARAQAESARARVESQRRLSVQLSRAATAEAAADIVLRRAIAVTSSVAGGVCLANQEGYLEFVAIRGIADDDVQRVPRLGLDDRSASSSTFRTGKESLATSAADFRSRFPDGYRIFGGDGRGVWALPLVAQGSRIGAVMLILDCQHLPSQDDRSAVRALAAQVAPALRRAQASDQTREAAEELQRAMLPSDLPSLPGTSVAGLYRSSTQILEVGGDWYDAVETRPDTIMVAVGDVVGRGASAAATTGHPGRRGEHSRRRRTERPGSLMTALDRFAVVPGRRSHHGGLRTAQRDERPPVLRVCGTPSALVLDRSRGRAIPGGGGPRHSPSRKDQPTEARGRAQRRRYAGPVLGWSRGTT